MSAGAPPPMVQRRMRNPRGGLGTFLLPKATQVPLRTTPSKNKQLERYEEAEKGLARNTPYHQLKRDLAKKYGVNECQAETYIRQARARWHNQPVVDAEQRRVELETQFQTFYQVCMSKGAYASAGRALRELGLLWGLYQQSATSLANAQKEREEEQAVEVDPERIRARMADLVAKHAEGLQRSKDGLPEDPHDAPQLLPPVEK
jgi:hypothetical protein